MHSPFLHNNYLGEQYYSLISINVTIDNAKILSLLNRIELEISFG